MYEKLDMFILISIQTKKEKKGFIEKDLIAAKNQ
jgi:hypothetical protein